MESSRLVSRFSSRLRALFRGRVLDRELDEELGFHLEHLIAEHAARGLTPEAARREALVAMGGIERRKEECRDTRGVRLLEDFLQDLRYAARTLRRAPAFTLTAIATLMLGIGTTVAMFSVVNGVLLRPLPFPQPDRLFLVSLSPKMFLMPQPGMADVTYLQFRERDRTFQHLAVFSSYKGNLTGAGDPVVLKMANVTTEFFDTLGVAPSMGRAFLPADGEEGRERTIVLSDQLWRSRFSANPGIVGTIARLNGIGHTVVGVMPAGFDFPSAMAAWTPRTVKITPGNSLLVPVVGRLKPDVSIEPARAAFETTFASLPDVSIDDRSKWDVGLIPLKELLVGNVRRPLQMFTAAVLVVLLIACANVANLLLARASGRDREIAVRAALGAGRPRLLRQLITETLLLSAIGAALGVLVARWTVAALLAAAPPGRIPRTEMVAIDLTAVAFAAGIAALTGVAFGLAPALRLTRSRSAHALVPAGRTFARSHERLRGALVVSEIALALVLLTGAGLMMQSFLRLRAVESGFDTDNVLRMTVELPTAKYATAEQLQLGPRQKLHAAVYQPYRQVGNAGFLSGITYVVRTASDPGATAPALRNVLRSMDKDQPAAAIGLMKDVAHGATATPEFYARLLSIFAVLALALALVGTYGVIAYSVAQRSHEIGLRMALGAQGSRVVALVLRRTGLLALGGVAIGAAAAWAATGFLRTLLFEITPTDPATFAVVTLAIFTSAMLAGTIPARRATRVDPLTALRHE